MSSDIVLEYAQRLYRITLDFAAVAEIEEEIGSLADFYARLSSAGWTVGELATVCHILLAQAGCGCDYMQLGQEMVRQGFARYRTTVARLLDRVFAAE